jgi:hypothetical protein
MGGNDKAGALAGTDLERHGQNGSVQHNFFANPGENARYPAFMTSPALECTCGEPKKRQKRPKTASLRHWRNYHGKVTPAAGLQSAPGWISSTNAKIIVLF